MRPVIRLSQLTVTAAIGLSLAACGSSSSSGGSTSAGSASSNATSHSSQATSGSPDTGSAATSGPSSSAVRSDQAGVPDTRILVHQARAAYGSAKSAKLHADMTDNGQQEVIDIRGAVNGSNQEVTIATQHEGTATIRTVSAGKSYVKGDKTFWTRSSGVPQTTAGLLADKWVAAPASAAKGLAGLSIKAILDSAMGPGTFSDAKLAAAKSAKSSAGGKDVYVITTSKGNTITLSADNKYVLEIKSERSTASSHGTMTLTGWNTQPTIDAPPNPVKVPAGK